MRLLLLPLLIGILLYSPNYAIADTDPNDASALRVMYSSLNSPGQLTKWTANGGDPCRVLDSKLSGLGLSGSLGYQLASLTSVTNFDISNNNLGNQLPYQLPPVCKDLSFCFKVKIFSDSAIFVSGCRNVSHNQIQGQVTVAFDTLSSLNTLDFSFNAMTDNWLEFFNGEVYMLNYAGITKSNGNSWNSGPAPPPPPGTPASRPGDTTNLEAIASPSDGGSSGDGGGHQDSQKHDNQPFAPLASQEVHELKTNQASSEPSVKAFEAPAVVNLRPPPIERLELI
ncbi:hypothetical protein HAX54_025571 [Datura stramonium]|uniref:Leucine-rich repeat-containing N-terminal plant-type domain-containing protein n=1 Tax=Datura stramonium TaxID=4076 RepID=A0ABS8S6G4_DATST|nr:hypothetical protein [Datura stramonium]